MAYKHKAYLGNKNASANKSKRAGHIACLINTKDIGLISSTSGKKNHPVTYVSFIFATALAFSTPGNMISLFGYRKKYE